MAAQHFTAMTKSPNTTQFLGSDDIMSLGIKSSDTEGFGPNHLFKNVVSSQQGSLRRMWSLGALGEGSGWDLRIRPAAAPAPAASGPKPGPKPGP